MPPIDYKSFSIVIASTKFKAKVSLPALLTNIEMLVGKEAI